MNRGLFLSVSEVDKYIIVIIASIYYSLSAKLYVNYLLCLTSFNPEPPPSLLVRPHMGAEGSEGRVVLASMARDFLWGRAC